MPLFRKKEKVSLPPPSAPEIPKLDWNETQHLGNLGNGFNEHTLDTTTSNGHARSNQPFENAGRIGSIGVDVTPSLQQSRKYDTMSNIANINPQDTRHTIGHKPKTSSLSRSISQGAVPYHLPWTRNLVRDDTGGMASLDQSQTNGSPSTSPPSASRRKMGPPPSAANNPHGLPALFNRSNDFRVSPNSIPQPTASQRRHVMDAARSQSLRRAKAPAELNLMVFGATGTGKTSFIRTLLATCDLSLCTDEAKKAASLFGISPDHKHPTHDMDPIMPLRTKQYEVLQGIDLHPSCLIPISALEAGAESTGRSPAVKHRTTSMISTRTNNTSGFGSGRVQLSICDTPGIDFNLEDDFEIEKKVNASLRFLEAKLTKTLSEENKVQRQPRGDGLMHLILYFIDPVFMIDRFHTRKAKILRARYASAQVTERNKSNDQQQKRIRSTSMVGNSSVSQPAAYSGSLSKQAQTAQLRQSMEMIQARSSSAKSKHSAKGSVSTVDMPSYNSDVQAREVAEEELDDEDDCVEGLSQRELSILSRLSERANVLPIIAKSDTLTSAQLEEVRTAVRNSIIKANIDLGAFEVEGVRRKKRIRPREPHPISSVVQRGELEESTPESSADAPLSSEPVKVIRIKSRRSYSAHSGERMAPSTSGHSIGGNNVFDETVDDGSNLGHTAPLFDSKASQAEDEDEEDQKSAPEAISKMVPFSVFVPEPIRVRSKQSNTQTSVPPTRKLSMNSIAENLPPVPKLPDDIASIKKGRPGTSSTVSHSDPSNHEGEKVEVLEAEAENGAGSGQQGGRQSLESASTHPTSNGSTPIPNGGGNRSSNSTPVSVQGATFSSPPPGPPQSTRFVREFRFGSSSVLDARHCDFSLLRTCILGSHVEKMREVTNDRYERFRSQRLEYKRQHAKLSSAGAL
ncbi:uncharacterized protein FA14DRAFT_161603 [Meira miltonrushii]|uniref:Septin-type G domain-containing protein n=1 Tax=Meira miltonrushii TaxID=1280837 RepID=A0A316V9B3_9BASI|nr:uncharacterized protein FA14DRAFT_161603 [Meira miltonrushii]PWN34042.1 hypothetical protein FA14DRAFT_161603 [Meira miltonrushii]